MDPRTQRCKEKYEGKTYFTKDGKYEFVVKEFNSAADIEIYYPKADFSMHKSQYDLSKGIRNPFEKGKIYFEDNKLAYENTFFWTNEGYLIKIIEYINISDVVIQFQDQYGFIAHTTLQNIRKGQVHNPYKVNKFGGYEGDSIYTRNGEYKYLYRIWYNILVRANDTAYYAKYHNSVTDAYDYCTIDPTWLNFSNFALWYDTEKSKLNPAFSYEVDKDLLFRFYCTETCGKKCYGPKYCVLIPHELNNKLQLTNLKKGFNDKNFTVQNFEVGVINASLEIKKCALKYYNDGAITQQVFNIINNS